MAIWDEGLESCGVISYDSLVPCHLLNENAHLVHARYGRDDWFATSRVFVTFVGIGVSQINRSGNGGVGR